jgi:hypothetical protein
VIALSDQRATLPAQQQALDGAIADAEHHAAAEVYDQTEARRCFPPRLSAPGPEEPPDPVPPNAGLPWLLLDEWIPSRAPSSISPRPPGTHGGRIGKLRKAMEAFLEGEGVRRPAPLPRSCGASMPSSARSDLMAAHRLMRPR